MAEYTDEQLNRIDALVAEKVMGWHWRGFGADDYEFPDQQMSAPLEPGEEWHPTRDRGQAMRVFEQCEDMRLDHSGLAYAALDNGAPVDDPACSNDSYTALAATPMLAICLAALTKVGVEVPDG